MFSFRPIGHDFGDPVPPTPADRSTEGQSPPANPSSSKCDIPKGIDIARAMSVRKQLVRFAKLTTFSNRSLSLAACGLFIQMDDSDMPPEDIDQPLMEFAKNDAKAMATASAATTSAALAQHRYVAAGSRTEATERAQGSLRRH